MLGLMCNDYLERDVYCCGPEGFMEGVREILNALGYDMDRYHQESFQLRRRPRRAHEFDDVVPQEEHQGAYRPYRFHVSAGARKQILSWLLPRRPG